MSHQHQPGHLCRGLQGCCLRLAAFRRGVIKEWAFGSTNNPYSLPVDYVMRGVLMSRICVGGQIDLYRTHRNGACVVGHFKSTPIVGLSVDGFVETLNSIYSVSLDQEDRS